MVDFGSIGEKAMDTIKNYVHKKPLSVISVNKEAGNWVVLVEVLERRAVPDTQNLIGIYKVTFDKLGKVAGYKRIEMRRKADTGTEEFAEATTTK